MEDQKVRTAAGMVLALFVLASVGTVLSMATSSVVLGPDLAITAAALAALVLSHTLIRRGHPRLGTALAISLVTAAIWAMALRQATHEATDALLGYAVVPLMMAGILLTMRFALFICGLIVLGTLAVATAGEGPGVAATDHMNLAILLVLVAGLAVAAAGIMQQYTRLVESQRNQLQQGTEERQRMLARVAHDLANPLSPILLQVSLMQKGVADIPRAAAILKRNAEALQRQVEDLKDLARVEGAALRLDKQPTDLHRLAMEAVETLRPEAERRGIRLAYDGLEAPLVADAGRLSQVLSNLLGNALKFTPNGGSVQVLLERTQDAIVLRVRDTGRGLAPDEVDRLFRPFSQVHAPGEVPERGTGLGLYICQGLAQAHGGTLLVESEGRGRGSTFTLRLPGGAQAMPPLSSQETATSGQQPF